MRVAAVVIAILAVIGWVMAALFLDTSTTDNEAETGSLAEVLIEDVTEKEYVAILDLVDTSDMPLLQLLVWSATGASPEQVMSANEPEITEDSDIGVFITEYFVPFRKDLVIGKVKSIDSRKIVEDMNYVVAIYSYTADSPFPLMTIKPDKDWKIDFPAMIAGTYGEDCALYTIELVKSLLKNPTKKKVDKAIEILDTAKGLEAKYNLWLEPEAEFLLPDEAMSSVAAGLALTADFKGLCVAADIARAEIESGKEIPDGDENGAISEPGKVRETRTLIGEGSQDTQKFELRKGVVIFHFVYEAGGEFIVQLINEDGLTVSDIADYNGPITGSTAAGVTDGIYGLRVECSGRWTVGIEEPAPTSAPFPPQEFSGGGPLATDFFQTSGKPILFNLKYEGSEQFIVTVLEESGNPVVLLANRTGPCEGSRIVTLVGDALYTLDVDATGPWNVDVTYSE